MRRFFLFLFIPVKLFSQEFSSTEIYRFKDQAAAVTIIRDNWGIPHVYGRSDANAVFGLLYAQCEDDFQRVELNYVEKLGRLSEIKGPSFIYNDLQIRMLIDSSDAIKDYNQSPEWLKKLLNAYADGINYFLFTHPKVKPQILTHFQPWYALLWTDGSIGAISVGDVTIKELKSFYSGGEKDNSAVHEYYKEELATGSNGFALAPSKTKSGNAILYINPHVTFYFRPEVHVVSEEGLNTYGAVTWGQMFVYQGFNEHCGWMHTSSYADVADLYAENIEKKKDSIFYHYENELRPVAEKYITINYLNGGKIENKSFKTYYSHHGPIMAERKGKWIAVRSYNRSVKSFTQSWLRNKASGFEDYKKTMQLLSNTSNNTVFADDKGNIAYWHGNFIPRRDIKYNWAKPVDGSIAATEWKGLHDLNEIVHVYNPASGFIQNCNSTPFTVSGTSSPLQKNYPAYMAPDGENFRGVNAVKILSTNDHYTIEKIIHDGYDSHLAAFDILLPALFSAYEKSKSNGKDSMLDAPINELSKWNRNSSVHSIATTLAILWAERLQPVIMKKLQEDDEVDQVSKTKLFVQITPGDTLLQEMIITIKDLIKKFGSWQIEWGNINRYQRITGDMNEPFNDMKPSLPDGYAASTWGCIPSFVSKTFNGSSKRYGYNGNSFICAVEFGKKVKARSLLTGGESGDPASPHFSDQAEMYTKGIFKEVLFYKEDVLKHAERTYHPGS